MLVACLPDRGDESIVVDISDSATVDIVLERCGRVFSYIILEEVMEELTDLRTFSLAMRNWLETRIQDDTDAYSDVLGYLLRFDDNATQYLFQKLTSMQNERFGW